MAITTSFQTLFAVPMSCQSCINEIEGSVKKLDGIQKVTSFLEDQLVSIEGTAAPSTIVEAIQATGRDAILRGSGTSNSAAVCILETHATTIDPVRGLARMVEVSPSLTLIDLTTRGLSPGQYWVTVRQTGDISRGAVSTGSVWARDAEKNSKASGHFGTITVGPDGFGAVFLDKPVAIWEMIGRGMVLSKLHDGEGPYATNDNDTVVGVIARSAGVWDNDKTVCSCSGKTVWEERKDEVKRGML